MGYLETLRANPGFRYLFGARVVSLLGDWLSMLAVIALLREVRGSDAAALSGFFILKLLPIFLAGPLAGVVADRFNRRTIMLVSDLLRAALVLGLLAAPLVGRPVVFIYALVLLQVVASGFFEPARAASLPQLVAREHLSAANALGAMAWSAVFAAGAAAGGVITELAGWRTALVIDAGTYVMSALLITRISLPRRERRKDAPGWRTLTGWRDLQEGFGFVRGRPDVATVLFVKLGWGVAGAITLLLTLFGERTYAPGGRADLGVSILFTARAVGTGVGPWLARRIMPLENTASVRLLLTAGFLWPAVFYFAFSFADTIGWAALFVAVAHFGGSIVWVYSSVLLQKMVPDQYLGRVSSADLGLATLAISISVWAYGTLAATETVGLTTLARVMALTLLAPAAAWYFASARWPARVTDDGVAPAVGWPGFGGPEGNFRVKAEGLADRWPEDGPPEIWRHPLGAGFSTIVADGGRLFVTSRDGDADVVQARSVSDGSVVWEQRYDSPVSEDHAIEFGTGPNASPLIHDGRLFSLSYSGALHAFDAGSGEPLWSRDLVKDFGGEFLNFGYSASPIVHDGQLIVLAGGEQAGALALDPADGAEIWRGSPSSVSYSTPIVIDLEGQQQLVYFSAESIIGIDASNGTRLWDFPVVNQYRNNSTGPQWGPGNLLWVATQLEGGTRALRLTRDGDATVVEEVWVSNKMSVHFWNTLRLGNAVFASVGGNGSILTAIDLTNGDVLWRQRGFEKVNFVHAGENTILLDADGKLALARLSAEDIEILSQAKISDETTWTAPTLVDGILYFRDTDTIRAFDLRAR